MEKILKELQEAFAQFKAAQAKADESLRALVKESADGTKESINAAVKQANDAAIQVQGFAARLLEIEQKMVGGVYAGRLAPKSLGALVVENDSYKAFAAGKTNKCRITLNQDFSVQANTITGQEDSPATNHDTLVPWQRYPGIIPGAFKRLRVRDILPGGITTSNMIEFTRELAFTNNAAETAEGASKPQSSLTFELATAPVVTIAHWLKVSTQIREDAPALMSYIDTRLRYGVDRRDWCWSKSHRDDNFAEHDGVYTDDGG